MARLNAGPSALTAAAAAAAAAFVLCCSSIGGVHAYAAKGLGGIASSGATHPSSSSALVPSSALARGGRYPGDYDDLPYRPPYLNDMDDYGPGPGPYGYGAFRFANGVLVCVHCVYDRMCSKIRRGRKCNGENWQKSQKHQRLGVHALWGEAPKARNSSIHMYIYNTCSECCLWLTRRNCITWHRYNCIFSFFIDLIAFLFCLLGFSFVPITSHILQKALP